MPAGRIIVCALLAAAPLAPATGDLDRPRLTGALFERVIEKGDSWRALSARHGIDVEALAALNLRTPATPVRAGETILIDSRHLAPRDRGTGLTINVPQRMLFLTDSGIVVAAYPVALGRPQTPTFVGRFSVIGREVDPVWDVPVSIQDEMRRAGKTVLTRVAPGPANPLGKHWLGLSIPGYGIHGTNAPLSIYRFETHGCIRLHPDDVADLWPRVLMSTPGEIIYEPVLWTDIGDDILLEAHRDVYRRQSGDEEARIRTEALDRQLSERIDWQTVRRVLEMRDGRPHSIALDWPAGRRE